MNQPASLSDSDLSLLASFVEEAREHLQAFGDGLLELEEGNDSSDVINSIFRAVHTIKGCARTLGCVDIGKLSHAGENVLDAIRKQSIQPQPEVMEVLFESCDLLNMLVAEVEQQQPQGLHDDRMEPLIGRLNALLCQPATIEVAPQAPAVIWPAPGTGLSSELVSEFVTECADHIAAMEAALLEFEKTPDNLDHLNSVFRAIHSIKGTADYVGLAQIKTLSHYLESVLDLLRKARLSVNGGVSDLVFAAADALKLQIRNLGCDAEQDTDLQPLVARLDEVVRITASQPAGSASASEPAGDPRLAVFVRSASQQIESVQVCRKKIGQRDTSESVVSTMHRAAATLISAAEYMGREEFVAPANQILDILDLFREGRLELDDLMLSVIDEQTSALQGHLGQVTSESLIGGHGPRLGDILCQRQIAEREEIESAAETPMRIGDKLVARGVASREEVEAAAAAQTGTPASAGALNRTMRVDQGKLDSYVNLAGELVVARNALIHVAAMVAKCHPSEGRQLKEAVDNVARVTRDIQDNAMSMRMVPVRNVFQRFPRMIRDIAKSQGKQVGLQLFGEDTELDKQVAEALGDPLVHLIRNAADHGIETPADRVAAGKSEVGAVTLRASREGNHIIIDVIDDGAGIRVNRLKAKAVESGVITTEQAESMPKSEALQLIFAPGLSTAKMVSDISGRGVGMDVVRNNIAALGGSVTVSSEEGKGSQLQIRLPLTLAISTVVLVGCGGEVFALPMESVVETVKVVPEQITRVNDEYMISLRGALLGVVPLSRLLCLDHGGLPIASSTRCDPLGDETGQVSIVVVAAGALRYGLIVDEFRGQQEIVVKPLPGYLAHLPGLGGATIMGEGTIVLVLDPLRLASLATGDVVRQGTAASQAA